MSGGWRVSEEEVTAGLRQVRKVARHERTQAAWATVAVHVAQCRRMGIPETEWLLDG